MTDEINVISRTQVINVEPTSGAISIIDAGPQGPAGPPGAGGGGGTADLAVYFNTVSTSTSPIKQNGVVLAVSDFHNRSINYASDNETMKVVTGYGHCVTEDTGTNGFPIVLDGVVFSASNGLSPGFFCVTFDGQRRFKARWIAESITNYGWWVFDLDENDFVLYDNSMTLVDFQVEGGMVFAWDIEGALVSND
jgi:hypothetical protein